MSNQDDEIWKHIIHTKCGLPIEFCECKDAEIQVVVTPAESIGNLFHQLRMVWYRIKKRFK